MPRPIPKREEIGEDTPLRLDVIDLDGFDGEPPQPEFIKVRRRDLITVVGPQTPLLPKVAVSLAFSNVLSAHDVLDAISWNKINSYRVADKTYVTLADINSLIQETMPRPSAVLGTIYFAGFGRYIKIGYTSGLPKERFKSIQTPEPLTLYTTVWGTKATEAALHKRFTRYRLKGEWFRFEQPIRRLVSLAQAVQWRRELFMSKP